MPVEARSHATTLDLNEVARRHFDWVERMGWHNKTVLEALALIGSEIGEACAECLAEPTPAFAEELADIVLRSADLAQVLGIDFDQAVWSQSPTWETSCLAGRMNELTVEFAKWVNTARKQDLDETFAVAMGRTIRRVLNLSEQVGADMHRSLQDKMAINEQRGTRGRRV